MVRPIMKDPVFLSRKSIEATAGDAEIGRDLLETLKFHKEGCVGMAANMIGVARRIIAFDCGAGYMVMFNPEIIKKSEPYETEEAACPCPVSGKPPATGRSRSVIRTKPCRSG